MISIGDQISSAWKTTLTTGRQALHSVSAIGLISSTLFLGACGGGSGSDEDGAPEFDIVSGGYEGESTTNTITGSAVDGPVQNAEVSVYVLDTSSPSLKGRLVATGSTDDQGSLTGIDISDEDMTEARFIVETVGGIDLTTNTTPVIPTMRTYITARDVNLIPKAVYATPLTTFTLTIAYELLSANPDEHSWETALSTAQIYVRNVYGLGLMGDDATGLDLFSTGPIANEDTNAEEALNYRVAIETFTAIVDQIHSDSSLAATQPSSNDVLEALASDLSDGVIDGEIDSIPLAVLTPVATNLQELATEPPAFIAGTEIPLSDIVSLFKEEAATIAADVDVPDNLSQPESSAIIAGVDLDAGGNGQIDALENCVGKYTLTATGTLEGLTDTIVNSTSEATGSASISANGDVSLEQSLLNIASIGNGTIVSTAEFSLETQTGTTTILGCTGLATICDGINSAVGTAEATSDFNEALTVIRGSLINDNNTPETDDDIQIDDAITIVTWTSTVEQSVEIAPGTFVEAINSSTTVLTAACEALPAVDTDGDGAIDAIDDFINDAAASVDTDGDGSPDEWNEGKSAEDSTTGLHIDKFRLDPAASIDTDDDGAPDSWNENQGAAIEQTILVLDAFRLDPAASIDDDNDGFPDAWNRYQEDAIALTDLTLDAFPGSPETTDTDGDGVGDIGDAFNTDAAASVDTDGDGSPDSFNTTAGKSTLIADAITAGIASTSLIEDAFPLDAAASIDDGDGYPDVFNDPAGKEASIADAITTGLANTTLILDQYPGDELEWVDADEDGFADQLADACVSGDINIDAGHTDADGDGVCEDDGATPLDACPDNGGYTDGDGDGWCGDGDGLDGISRWDFDDSNASITDPCFTNSGASAAVLLANCVDDDNDGIPSVTDLCPFESTTEENNINTDRDAIADASKGWPAGDESCDINDDDDDADGILDGDDTGPLDYGLPDLSPTNRDQYIFNYNMTSTGAITGNDATLDDGSTAGSSLVVDPATNNEVSKTATFNVITKKLEWNDVQRLQSD